MPTRRQSQEATLQLNLRLPLLAGAALASLLASCSCSSGSTKVAETPPAGDEAPEIPTLAFTKYDAGLPVGGTWRGYPSLIDFTGDGRDDIVVSNREEDGWNAWTSHDPKAGWQQRIEGLPRNLFYGGQDGADVDGDGDLDLILASHTLGVMVYLNDGNMKWTDANPETKIETPSMLLDIVQGNFNGDEHPDIFGIGHFNGGLNVYLGEDEGKFRRLKQSTDLIGVERAFGMQVELADLDGDGDDDLVAATDKGLKVFFTENDGDELSWNEFSEGLPIPSIGNTIRGIACADFNGDGQIDVGWCGIKDPLETKGTGNHIGVYEWLPGSKSWQQFDSGLHSDGAFMDLKTADFNQDGHLDLAAVSTMQGLTIYLGDGKGNFELKGIVEGVYGKSKIDVGNVDGDEWPDLLISLQQQKNNNADGGVWTLLNSKELWD